MYSKKQTTVNLNMEGSIIMNLNLRTNTIIKFKRNNNMTNLVTNSLNNWTYITILNTYIIITEPIITLFSALLH